jgi:hypothetical protein
MEAAVASEVEDAIGEERADDLSALVGSPKPTETPGELGVLVEVGQIENCVRDEACV